ncbi:hypothetical protein GOP47_0016432 [Adiantum capillus-veneris]|uniref:SAM-dependent methyltransferase TRM5/TYW2-type domain-containing protein n=1 Tax=Adiantum capillus-veneris TaxID=13818 RepID=A0A9D4UI26_ADICA|nr:hypothetical protein GOP47_0016432 [Adiantum capillus-veneris]
MEGHSLDRQFYVQLAPFTIVSETVALSLHKCFLFGITSARRRIIAAVRCTIRIETPIAKDGQLLVSEDYLRFLVQFANEKMLSNSQRIERFFCAFINQVEGLVHKEAPDSICEANKTQVAKSETQLRPRSIKKSKGCDTQARKFLDLERRQVGLLLRLDEVEASFFGPNSGHVGVSKSFCGMENVSSRECKDTSLEAVCQLKLSLKDQLTILNTAAQVHQRTVRPSNERGRFKCIQLNSLKASELLYRWGHSACPLPPSSSMPLSSLLIFGGYGGSIKQGRQNDLVLLTIEEGKVQSIDATNPPVARMGHTACLVGQDMVVIGGRKDPSKLLGDVCVLRIDKMQWTYPKVGGAYFPPRHRHAAEAFGGKIYVFGGLNNDSVLGDLFLLDTLQMKWEQLIFAELMPPPRYSHSIAIADKKLFLYGGFDGRKVYGDLWLLDLNFLHWRTVVLESIPRFSHSMTFAVGHLVILGGCPLTKHANAVSFLDVEKLEWVHGAVDFPSESFFVRHSATGIGDTIVIVGGGLSCYAFGIKFSPPFLVDLPVSPYFAGRHKVKEFATLNKDHYEENARGVYFLRVDKAHAKVCKDHLKLLGRLDSRRKSTASEDGMHILFPLVAANGCDLGAADPREMLELNKAQCSICAFDCHINLKMVKLEAGTPLKPLKDPHEMLLKALSPLLQKHKYPVSLLREIPKRWERLDDMAILPAESFTSECWSSFGPVVWQMVTNCFSVNRLARQARIKPNSTRDSNLVLLYGHDGWVRHRENGILYCFDATKCMFSSGNISEKLRMAKLDCKGETVVDLFAGIGYFVLPFLAKAKAKKVYACEWNPPALDALRYNLDANAVEDRAVVLEGDNQVTAPQGVADRVCLGLLPTSEHCWGVALKALRPDGGVLHIHGNVKDTEEQQWVDHVCSSVEVLSRNEGRSWNVHAAHVERVKWYAPHVRHLVVDVKCVSKGD